MQRPQEALDYQPGCRIRRVLFDEAEDTWRGGGGAEWKTGAMERFLPSSTNPEKSCLMKRKEIVLEAKGSGNGRG